MIKLTIIERIKATDLMNQFKGSLDKLVSILDDLKALNMTEQEIKDFGIKVDSVNVTWSPEHATTETEINLSTVGKQYLLDAIKAKSDNNEITLADVGLIGLQNKLK